MRIILSLVTLLVKGLYSKVYLVKTDNTTEDVKETSTEEIIFDNLVDEEKGGMDYAAAALVRTYEEGSDLKLKCPSPIDFQDCQFKAPYGTIFKLGISGKPYRSHRVRNLHGVRHSYSYGI